jgi:hypothetical protein
MAEKQDPVIKEFTGTTAQMRDSEFLASEDFIVPGKDGYAQVVVTIEKVLERRNLTFADGRKKARAFTLRLVGKDRELLINATNREMLKKMFGMDSKTWIGQRVLLWVDPTVKLKGEIVPGIRIKPAPEPKP